MSLPRKMFLRICNIFFFWSYGSSHWFWCFTLRKDIHTRWDNKKIYRKNVKVLLCAFFTKRWLEKLTLKNFPFAHFGSVYLNYGSKLVRDMAFTCIHPLTLAFAGYSLAKSDQAKSLTRPILSGVIIRLRFKKSGPRPALFKSIFT